MLKLLYRRPGGQFQPMIILAVLVMLVVGLTTGPVRAQSTGQNIAAATQRLFQAVEDNDMAGAQISIGGGADINAVNDWGLTPVDLAVDKGYFKIVHYLLSVREIRKSAPPPPTRVAAPPPPQPIVTVDPTAAPAPPAMPVAGVYSPPPGTDPWSATVVTTTTPPQPPVRTGPSPFDADIAAPKPLAIIGDVRGPETVVEAPPVIAAMKPIQEPVPETGQDEPGFIESLLHKYLGRAPETVPPPVKMVEPAPAVPPETVKYAVITAPTPPASRPGVTGPPPPIEGKLMPDVVENAPLSDLPVGELQTPRVVSVAPKLVTPRPIAPVANDMANLEAEPEPEPSPQEKQPVLPEPVQQPPAEPIGRTTPPGKPQVETSWFKNFKSFFSSEEEESDTDKKAPADADGGDWRVKEIEQAQIAPRPPVKKNEAVIPKRRLDGVILTLGRTTSLGKTPPPQAPAPWFYKSCINKKLSSIVFCIEPLDWPDEIKTRFLTDTVMYDGTQTIVRYDEGSATYFHTLFPSTSYPDVIDFFTRRYGPPTRVLKRSIAPLAAPRMANPTVIWQSRAPVTNLLTTLEIRLYDDNRGSFPDTKRGAVYLYHEWSQPVFPQLSSVELMLLQADKKTR